MNHTPERIDRVIEAVRQHNLDLPYIPDAGEANKRIGKLVEALEDIQTHYRQYIKRSRPHSALVLINEAAQDALAEARKLPGEAKS